MTAPFTLPIPTYQCHKRVQALRIKAVVQNPRGFELHFEDERFVPMQVDDAWVYAKGAEAGGYVVWYGPDNYMSWSPAAAFEAGYRLVAPAVVMDDETAKARMDAALWDFIDTAAMYPTAKPDPRIWDHVMVYAPPGPANSPPPSPLPCSPER